MPVPKGSTPVAPSQKLKCEVRLGINVIDLMRLEDSQRPKVVKTGMLKLSHPITIGDGGDERFVELGCDLLTGAKLIDFLQKEGRVSRSAIPRAYIKKGEGEWSKLPFTAVLVETDGETSTLSEKVFPVEVEAAPFVPKPVEVVLGRKRK